MTTLILGAALLAGCERPPSFVGPWDVVRVERGGDEQVDLGFLDFDGERNVVVFLAYDHGGDGFVPLRRPVYEVVSTNVEAVDVEAFYDERTPIARLEIDGFGAFRIEEYTGIRTVLSGDVTWLGGLDEEQTTMVLRR